VRESLILNRSAGDGPGWVSEGPILPRRPGNAGRGKGPWFWVLRPACLDVKPVREPDAGKPHVRFDERVRETESWTGY